MPHSLKPPIIGTPKAIKDPKDPFVLVRPLALEDTEGQRRSKQWKLWRPLTLRAGFLLAVVATTLGLIALINVLTIRSQHAQGLIFAVSISKLPWYRTFLYQCLPTVIAVLYSLTWSWIDLDTKRTEPYRQLSKPGGAKAEDSLLLHYPFDFLASVPLKSLRRRHWPVFVSSCGLVLVAWAITPLQAAIFATHTIDRTVETPMRVSNSYLTLDDQASQVTANYTYSVYGITWLNERLPLWMTRQAALASFQPITQLTTGMTENWMAETTLYSVDVNCEPADLKNVTEDSIANKAYTKLYYTSTHGCRIPYPYGPEGKDIVGEEGLSEVKQFSALYAGYQNHDGLADFYISPYCPSTASHVFLAAFANNRRSSNDSAGRSTTLFCEPTYYQQRVNATFSTERGVTDFAPLGQQQPLANDVFNTSRLEWQMNSGIQQSSVRGNIPGPRWPDQTEQLSKLHISLQTNGAKLPIMAGLAIGAYGSENLNDYLDPETLAASYQAAYRLLFARAMVDVLKLDLQKAASVNGSTMYQTQAVYVVPGFAYAVEGLLGVVIVLTVVLLVLIARYPMRLRADPASITAVMALVAKENRVLQPLLHQDQGSMKQIEASITGRTYALECKDESCRIVATGDLSTARPALSAQRPNRADSRAFELSLPFGIMFFMVEISLIATIAYFYAFAKNNGITLPSQNRIVRQLLENYIPTIIATLIEPTWVVLNRLLCVLQPLQELRGGNALAKRSIELNYSSLPPQLVMFKALGAKHVLLAAVCSMALLSNLLAVAFSSIFNEDIATMPIATNYTQPYQALFGSVDGYTGPWNASAGTGAGLDQFYIAMSNLTSGTPMPAWTDDAAFYVPFTLPPSSGISERFSAVTTAFGVDVDCRELRQGEVDSWSLRVERTVWQTSPEANLTVQLADEQLGHIDCFASYLTIANQGSAGECASISSALEVVTPIQAAEDAPPMVREACRFWTVSAWFRNQGAQCTSDANATSYGLGDDRGTVIACRPEFRSQAVKLEVSAAGMVQAAAEVEHKGSNIASLFQGPRDELLLQANNFLVGMSSGANGQRWRGGTWHNDSFPSDWNNLVMQKLAGGHDLLDPQVDVPDLQSAIALFSRTYKKLFAIWLSINHDRLLVPAEGGDLRATGSRLQQETRIFVVEPMFGLAITILSLFAITTVLLFARRPGRFLLRLPTTIASLVALFAASRALEDDSAETKTSRSPEQTDGVNEDKRFGYGSFLGTDRKIHIGIEREPLVTVVETAKTR